MTAGNPYPHDGYMTNNTAPQTAAEAMDAVKALTDEGIPVTRAAAIVALTLSEEVLDELIARS